MPSIDTIISQLYRATDQVPLADYRRWALEALRPLIHFDGAIWGTGHLSTGQFYTHTRVDVSKQLFDDILESHDINPISQHVFQHLITPFQSQPPIPENVRNRLGKPIDMADLVADDEFYQSAVYQQLFKPHGIERILSSIHVDERSGIFTLLTLYRYERDQLFTATEKAQQQQLLFHLLSASSHACFLQLQRSHSQNAIANALCDSHGNYHEVEQGFLDLMDSYFGPQALHKLPIDITLDQPQTDSIINGLRVEMEAVGELFRIGIRPEQPLDKLTDREQQVVGGICKGLTFKIIAKDLQLSPSTVSNHLYRVYRKLGINSRSELVRLMEEGQ